MIALSSSADGDTLFGHNCIFPWVGLQGVHDAKYQGQESRAPPRRKAISNATNTGMALRSTLMRTQPNTLAYLFKVSGYSPHTTIRAPGGTYSTIHPLCPHTSGVELVQVTVQSLTMSSFFLISNRSQGFHVCQICSVLPRMMWEQSSLQAIESSPFELLALPHHFKASPLKLVPQKLVLTGRSRSCKLALYIYDKSHSKIQVLHAEILQSHAVTMSGFPPPLCSPALVCLPLFQLLRLNVRPATRLISPF
jgi:hypothetical protein